MRRHVAASGHGAGAPISFDEASFLDYAETISSHIRHQHKARAGLVQPPGGEQAAAGVGPAHKVHHSNVVFVRGRTHHTLGFVQHDVHILLQDERLPVQRDSRAGRHLSVRAAAHRAVHAHQPFLNGPPYVRAALLGRARHILIQTHAASPPPAPGRTEAAAPLIGGNSDSCGRRFQM